MGVFLSSARDSLFLSPDVGFHISESCRPPLSRLCVTSLERTAVQLMPAVSSLSSSKGAAELWAPKLRIDNEL